MENELTHFDQSGNAVMVDVTEKNTTHRIATARGSIAVNAQTFEAIQAGSAQKGDVLGVARVAGIMAAKKTSELIPLCHPLALTKCTIDFELVPDTNEVIATCTVKVTGQTGVEMEALTGVTVALLTIYDMCKAIDKGMEIKAVYLVHKSGGKSGDFNNPNHKE
ncbi:cyclic pyranopterin monophosphate synthase MoaC [Hydrogenoanaerobacterium sp.]|uniref:cyclic pyranopterin monophosphate synthase MoaC n=1 Tax=Hydrogenoanaerobacterium sp. TaxID=2953763 RepID=UPI0028A1774B|nr:cyclic pyranopterin monophosphate synthase MoaC [Hydrogenoanaerobacterium sp.]